MRVLVIGGGAREHALVARLAAERDVAELVCAPGNPGMAAIARIAPIDISRPGDIADLAAREQIDITVVGPELPGSRRARPSRRPSWRGTVCRRRASEHATPLTRRWHACGRANSAFRWS